MKDKSAVERLQYSQQIIQSERDLETLQASRRETDTFLQELEIELHQQFRNLQLLQEEMIAAGSYQEKWADMERQGRYDALKKLLENSQSDMERYYRAAMSEIDTERQQLQVERDALPWG